MTFEKIAAVISEQLGTDLADIKPQSRIIEDLGADSLDVVELLMSLEEQFDISVSEEQATKLSTVADILKLIEG